VDSYNLHIKSTQQQFEAELRDTVQALPIPNKNTWFGVEAGNLFHPDMVSILMVVWYPEEYQEIPKEMFGMETDAEGNPFGELHLQRADVGPQTRTEQVPSAIRCRCFQHGSGDLRVNIKCVDERASTFCERLVKELARRWPGAWQQPSRGKQKERQGPPPMEERDDWSVKLAQLERWERAVKSGADKEAQANLIAGVTARTMEQWRKRRDAIESTNNE